MVAGSNNTGTAHCRGSVSPGRHDHVLSYIKEWFS